MNMVERRPFTSQTPISRPPNRSSDIEVKPKSQTLRAWQYNGQPMSDWPDWVLENLTRVGTELFLKRRSGLQLLSQTEWLLKHPDERDLRWSTDAEFKRDYEW